MAKPQEQQTTEQLIEQLTGYMPKAQANRLARKYSTLNDSRITNQNGTVSLVVIQAVNMFDALTERAWTGNNPWDSKTEQRLPKAEQGDFSVMAYYLPDSDSSGAIEHKESEYLPMCFLSDLFKAFAIDVNSIAKDETDLRRQDDDHQKLLKLLCGGMTESEAAALVQEYDYLTCGTFFKDVTDQAEVCIRDVTAQSVAGNRWTLFVDYDLTRVRNNAGIWKDVSTDQNQSFRLRLNEFMVSYY